MTLSALTAKPSRPIPDIPSQSPLLTPGQPFHARPGEWKICLALVLFLSLFYLLIENGRWHPGADTAFYVSLARSLVHHEGFRFNGIPQGKAPPLWPLFLAGAMKLSTSFWFLNLIPASCLVSASAFWYWVTRRFVTPAKAFSIVLLSSTLFFWYTSAVQLRTEALFCFLFSAAMLLAFQVSEGLAQWWRIASVVALCSIAVGVRWVGLVCWLPVAFAMLSGQLTPTLNRRWIGAALVALFTISSFCACRQVLRWLPTKQLRVSHISAEDIAAAADESDSDGALSEDMDASLTPAMQKVVTNPGVVKIAQRFGDSGKWISSLLWMPMYLGVTAAAVGYLSNAVGWVLIALFLLCLYDHLRNRQWVLLGVLLFCSALVFRWRYPNPRYLVPLAPLIILGSWLGMHILIERCQTLAYRRFWKIASALFVTSLVLCNGALWAVDVYIARSNDFYGNYMAGENDQLIAAAKFLNDANIKHGQVAVSFYYINLNRTRKNGQGLRSMHLLTNRLIRSVPKRYFTEDLSISTEMREWAATRNVRYYLFRPPVSPWRAHHFHIGWWQKYKTKQANIPTNPSWVLYDLKHNKTTELPPITNWPTHVPGM
ncbi:MAG: ArnT family glycosyltransferase [Bacillota bacterium]